MNVLLAFAPFLVFVVLERVAGVEPGLLGAAATALGFLLRDLLLRKQTPKVLEVGTVVLFGGLACYGALAGADWSTAGVRLAVDAGLLAIVLVSLVIRRPFTLQYARESVPRAVWDEPGFVRTNTTITAAWALAFAAMVAVDFAWLVRPDLPPRVVVVVTLVALVGAARFTGWYPERARTAASSALP
ncbi:hypothetical protein tb265_47040 [Gemmatimonadetes bacterium T265]|nr:hypothetical protein tb265_47040 [Gemmatimonadetes bacterium T265]